MKCNSYQDVFEKYLDDAMDEDEKQDLEKHIESCEECSEKLRITKVSEMVISEEKSLESNPFLSTRIVARLYEAEKEKVNILSKILSGKALKPVLITSVITIAVILGIGVGNISLPDYYTQQVPDEIFYMNDAEIESLDLYLTE